MMDSDEFWTTSGDAMIHNDMCFTALSGELDLL